MSKVPQGLKIQDLLRTRCRNDDVIYQIRGNKRILFEDLYSLFFLYQLSVERDQPGHSYTPKGKGMLTQCFLKGITDLQKQGKPNISCPLFSPRENYGRTTLLNYSGISSSGTFQSFVGLTDIKLCQSGRMVFCSLVS